MGERITRREFLKKVGIVCASLAVPTTCLVTNEEGEGKRNQEPLMGWEAVKATAEAGGCAQTQFFRSEGCDRLRIPTVTPCPRE